MKYVKMFGLLAVAAAALMAFAGPASADRFTSPTGTVYTGAIKAVSGGHVVIDNPIAKIECASTIEWKVENHGSGVFASGNVSSLTFSNCTNSWHVTVVAAGSLRVGISGSGYNGLVLSSGATIEATRLGITCRYATNNTLIALFTGGSSGTMDLGEALPFHSGSIFCGSGGTSFTGAYDVVSPTNLFFDDS